MNKTLDNRKKLDDSYNFAKTNQLKFASMMVNNFSDLEHVSSKTLKRVKNCSTNLIMHVNNDYSSHKIVKINACNHKYCPICQHRKSVRESFRLSKAIKFMSMVGYDFYFVTLTIKNVGVDFFRDTVRMMQDSLNRFMKYKNNSFIKGYFSKFEFTRNWHNGTFHPHLHLLIAVKKGFHVDSDAMFQDWCKANVAAGNSIPLSKKGFFFESVTDSDNASKEMAKYVVKSSDLFLSNYDFVQILNSTYGLKTTNSGGFLKLVLKMVDADRVLGVHFFDKIFGNEIITYDIRRELTWDSYISRYLVVESKLDVSDVSDVSDFSCEYLNNKYFEIFSDLKKIKSDLAFSKFALKKSEKFTSDFYYFRKIVSRLNYSFRISKLRLEGLSIMQNYLFCKEYNCYFHF